MADPDSLLDRPIWHALTGPQARLGVGEGPARRYRSDISPFVACRDDEPASLAAVAPLIDGGNWLLFLQRGSVPLPPGCREIESGLGVQMVARYVEATEPPPGVEPLQPDDWPEMLALAKLTKPGPFRARTPEFGQFWGVKDGDGRLLAMAGERLRLPGMSEVSGVCTHPDAQGRGFGAILSQHVSSEIIRRGETPFLHAYADNDRAIRLYERLGFVLRCEVAALVVARCD